MRLPVTACTTWPVQHIMLLFCSPAAEHRSYWVILSSLVERFKSFAPHQAALIGVGMVKSVLWCTCSIAAPNSNGVLTHLREGTNKLCQTDSSWNQTIKEVMSEIILDSTPHTENLSNEQAAVCCLFYARLHDDNWGHKSRTSPRWLQVLSDFCQVVNWQQKWFAFPIGLQIISFISHYSDCLITHNCH